jgi:hypothetical protein
MFHLIIRVIEVIIPFSTEKRAPLHVFRPYYVLIEKPDAAKQTK